MRTITLKGIAAKSKYGENFWRTGLCRSEFEKYRIKGNAGKFTYIYNSDFRKELRNYLVLKRKISPYWMTWQKIFKYYYKNVQRKEKAIC